MNKPNIKVIEIEVNNSFDFIINNLINSIKPRKIDSLKELIDYMLGYINKDIYYDLFADLSYKMIDSNLKTEINRRVNIINKKLMPIFHPLFNKIDFIKFRIENMSLQIDTINNNILGKELFEYIKDN